MQNDSSKRMANGDLWKNPPICKKSRSPFVLKKKCLLWHHAFKIHPSKSKQQIAEEIISSSSSQSVNQWHSPFRKYPSLKEHFKPYLYFFLMVFFNTIPCSNWPIFPSMPEKFSNKIQMQEPSLSWVLRFRIA